ncbi:DUF4136 domain-containing protein [Ichthyenterobacterium sp. W332]|uniref:DUF4136 domain-containing protein n=1 Tax=Microcosmobacter mediterraneus TaxID=3075607 RepID=A0ABU2YJR3_9FLAO|nr:DUF4136 domain-containing protein [Ichthyenterobacterium sp. W332]MDT0558410.1 DUF4136 domain-containing protein [Ichthyenterobacterium sp. W332]
MRFLKVLILSLLLVSCGATVNYDYDNKTDFTSYKTYNYFTDIKSGLSELDFKRLIAALDTAMASKGYTLSENPDFYIDVKSQEFRNNSGNNVGVGVGSGGRNVGGGVSIGFPIGSSKLNREIILDFVDKDRTNLFWQAVSESAYNPKAKPEKREAAFVALVNKILSQYPPK